MTSDEPPTRRALREHGDAESVEPVLADADPETIDLGTLFGEQRAEEEAPAPAPAAPARAAAPAPARDPHPVALSWVDEAAVQRPLTDAEVAAAAYPYVPVTADLLAEQDGGRSSWARRILLPLSIVVVLAGTYAASTLLWPLDAVAPTAAAVEVATVPAPPAVVAWPEDGTAALQVEGTDEVLSSSTDVRSIASITKVVTALLVQEAAPLQPGDEGDAFTFTWADSQDYWSYRYRGESALDVPVGGTLSQFQMLEGMLIGSANNYAHRLAAEYWDSDAEFVTAANAWLADHDVDGVTVTDPTGIDAGNTADAASLVRLGEIAMEDPVIAGIVGTEEVTLPGAGVVENTNELLADPGVLGIKTGWLDSFNLLSAEEIVVGTTPVRMYAAVLGQPDEDSRFDTSRELYDSVQAELVSRRAVPAGTVAGAVETAWGEEVDVITATDGTAILWNGESATVAPTMELGDADAEGDVVGTMSVVGPLNSTTVDLVLADDVEGPDGWWRLTHPLLLWGITG
ncbi:D-alanyl-D-alanine carboxypeptidase family protein [Microbacterium terricola]|uniref:Peptidase S11 D-alanyl-D-alanine carboxypeptidase A N-terminal domain-containing protein n=1 Tax=Microbacterium terricola TaxID=344163 RepID=A0ABM8E2C5_9MICO|nr:D-alanyl-D-alanine carboxypeptidase [Microbacterium terricola]UYK40181.1 D-alanyl-D-alanine carboxypeptidase [Microbacterium terricola]BDV32113.1 hypothetical protein Microterr_27730 [Microbacterium terricola]